MTAPVILRGGDADRAILRLQTRARPMPSINELGADLTTTSRGQLSVAIIRPVVAVGGYVWASSSGHWIVAVMLVAAVFFTDVVVVHDLMHHSLGVSRRTNSLLLGVLTLLMLDSGHVLAATHSAHHRLFPSKDDPEAYLAGWAKWRVLCAGPTYRYRLWTWAWRQHPQQRPGFVTEFALQSGILAAAIITTATGHLPELGVYVLVATLGSWLFPFVSVSQVTIHTARRPFNSRRPFVVTLFHHSCWAWGTTSSITSGPLCPPITWRRRRSDRNDFSSRITRLCRACRDRVIGLDDWATARRRTTDAPPLPLTSSALEVLRLVRDRDRDRTPRVQHL